MKKLLRELINITQIYKKQLTFSKNIKIASIFAVTLAIGVNPLMAQAPGCPNVYAGEDIELDCETECTDLTATFLDTGATTSYGVNSIPYDPPFPFTGGTPVSVNTDDVWSQIIPLPFDFSFFGTNYTQFLIGSNGVVTFDTNNNPPGGFCNWSFSASVPSPSLISGAIYGVYMDIDPSVAGSGVINYEFFGEAPCRTLVVNFPNIPYYGSACVGMSLTSQIVIYETTNVIEVYVENRASGCSWNSGNAIIGVQNVGGSQGITPAGRNTGDWSASLEAWRFSPNGSSIVDFAWLNEDGDIIGTTTTIEVCPTEEVTTYTARATYNIPSGDPIVVTDDVVVTSCVTAQPDCYKVDFLEDFSTGTGRHETPYTNYLFQPFGEVNDGEYVISNTNLFAGDLNFGWHVGMEDHTPDDVDGMMLYVNAAFDPGEFYRRTIPLFPNIDYTFSAWITTVYDTDTNICAFPGIPANVIFRIEDTDGNMIAETITGDIQNGPEPDWQEYLVNFNSQDFTEIQVVLINNSIGGCGNDLAIDDISLYYEGDLPVVVTPEDMEQCDVSGTTSTFDLTTQIPIILDGQDPAEFNISFHLSEANASLNVNAIANPEAYVNTANPETIFVRAERADLPTCFVIVNFDLIVTQGFEIITGLPESVTLCEGDEFPPLDATPLDPDLDPELLTYEWFLNGNLVSEEAVYTPTQAGTYTVTIVYDGCSTSTYTIEVIVQEAPLLDLGEDQTLCDGDSFEIIPIISGTTDEATYLWNTGATTETITVSMSGTYTLEITDGVCVVSDSVDITFGDYPDVELGQDIRSCPGEIHVITAVTSHLEVTFIWYENDVLMEGETGSSIQIVVSEDIINTSVIYRVEVDSNGCVSTDEIMVRAYENNPNCIITQGLSPDDTPGYNDFLDLSFLANRVGIANLQIMNRHGRLVYEKNNYVNEWAGQSNEGELLPTGTYYYAINLSTNDPVYGNQITGWIYINRKK